MCELCNFFGLWCKVYVDKIAHLYISLVRDACQLKCAVTGMTDSANHPTWLMKYAF